MGQPWEIPEKPQLRGEIWEKMAKNFDTTFSGWVLASPLGRPKILRIASLITPLHGRVPIATHKNPLITMIAHGTKFSR